MNAPASNLPHCSDCGSRLSVEETNHFRGLTVRRLRCPCGSRFESEEIVTRRLPPVVTRARPSAPVTTDGVQVGTGGHPPPPVVTEPPAVVRGVGGVLPSGSDPDPDSGPILAASPIRARAESNGEATKYPQQFEILWEQTGKRGGKFPAFKAWGKGGRPGWVEVQAAWRAYLLSERPIAGFVQDLSTWLNARGHQQEWPPAPPAAKAAPDARCVFHRLPNTRGKPARFPQAACPECKHATAARRDRQGEPTPAAAIVPATREQLAAMRPAKRISAVIRGADGAETPVDLEAVG